KWSVGNHFGFCFPGLCIIGVGGGRVHLGGGGRGRIQYNGGCTDISIDFRECKPLTCWSGSCDACGYYPKILLFQAYRRSTAQGVKTSKLHDGDDLINVNCVTITVEMFGKEIRLM
ncbi:LOW QUALITY PROTEIN: hypothetical protein HID58_027423, partial [Brassica napus]